MDYWEQNRTARNRKGTEWNGMKQNRIDWRSKMSSLSFGTKSTHQYIYCLLYVGLLCVVTHRKKGSLLVHLLLNYHTPTFFVRNFLRGSNDYWVMKMRKRVLHGGSVTGILTFFHVVLICKFIFHCLCRGTRQRFPPKYVENPVCATVPDYF